MNVTTCVQIITKEDTTGPTFTCPSNVTIECDQDENDLSLVGDVTDEADNCDTSLGEATFMDSVSTNDPCIGASVITRTWSLRDACMNVTTCVQVITKEDSTAPTFKNLPRDTLVSCGPNTEVEFNNWIADFAGATYCDNCSADSEIISYTNPSPAILKSEFSIEGPTSVWFVIEDACGNLDSMQATFSVACIAVAKELVGLNEAASGLSGNFDATFNFIIENTGNVNLVNIGLVEDFATQYGGAFIGIVTPPNPSKGGPDVTYDGSGVVEMLDMTADLLPGEQFAVTVTVEVDRNAPGAIIQPDGGLDNQATVTGTPADLDGNPTDDDPVTDDSDSGSDPTSTNPDEPGDNGTSDDPTPLKLPAIAVAKSISSVVPTVNGAFGNYDVEYTFVIENLGNTILGNISLVDDFASQYGGAFVGIASQATATLGGVSATYDSTSANPEMLDLTATLAIGGSMTVTVVAEVDLDNPGAIYNANGELDNQATTTGQPVDVNGEPLDDPNTGEPFGPDDVSDISDSGTDPEGNNPDEPGDEGTPDDPTPLQLPVIGVAKTIASVLPTVNGALGNFDVQYVYEIKNIGNTILTNISLVDDLASQYGRAFVKIISQVTATQGGVSATYDGTSTNSELLDLTATLVVGGSMTVTVVAEIDPDNPEAIYNANGELDNQATTTGQPVDGNGEPLDDPNTGEPYGPDDVSDISDSGTNPEGNNPDEPGDEGTPDDPTSLSIPQIAVAKSILGFVPSVSGTIGNFDVSYSFVIENTGNVNLINIGLIEDFATQYGGAFIRTVTPSNPSEGGPNFTYNGSGVLEMLDMTADLLPGEQFTITITGEVDPDAPDAIIQPDGTLNNQATATGTPADLDGNPTGDDPVTDDSDSGTDPETTNPNEPGDTGSDNDPTPVIFPPKVGNYVWEDCNGNGIQDVGEMGMESIRVELYDFSGNFVLATFTDVNGQYVFYNIDEGDYYLKFYAPSGYDFTSPNLGSDYTMDSDVNGSNGEGTTSIFTLSIGDCDFDSGDVGFYECVLIGETVWYDANGNDVQDPTENGVNGVKVEIYKDNDGVWELYNFQYTGHKPNTPSDDGYWKMCVPPGQYYVEYSSIVLGLTLVSADVGNNDLIDSDVTGMNGPKTTDTFTIGCADERCDIGAGYEPMSTIGDRVWEDSNGNGMLDSGERGIESVDIMVYTEQGILADQTVSDSDGNYYVDYLEESNYYIQFMPPNGFVPTISNIGDDVVDSDIDSSNGVNTTATFRTVPGEHIADIDAGFVKGAILSNLWLGVSAQRINNDNQVEWTVASDSEVDYYVVQSQLDGGFEDIGRVMAEKVTDQYTYQMIDGNVSVAGTYYYRVIAHLHNGEMNESDIVSIRIETESESDIKIYPNPAVESIKVSINNTILHAKATLTVRDISGRVIISEMILDDNLKVGEHIYPIDIDRLQAGVYSIDVTLNNSTTSKKIVLID